MARPRKNEVVESKLDIPSEKKDDGLVELEHFVSEGRMTIGNVAYDIVNHKVRVKPEHIALAREHIRMAR